MTHLLDHYGPDDARAASIALARDVTDRLVPPRWLCIEGRPYTLDDGTAGAWLRYLDRETGRIVAVGRGGDRWAVTITEPVREGDDLDALLRGVEGVRDG